MAPELFDAHNHAHDSKLQSVGDSLWTAIRSVNIRHMVVNGSSEEDWADVLALARSIPEVVPSFGYHPWYIRQRSVGWEEVLSDYLDQVPSGMGEIGLDRWIEGYDLPDQEKVFVAQLRVAAERDLPVTIHCLRAWGKLYDLIRCEPIPKCGFVLHSFGGPAEMVAPLARLGGYFSFPGYFAHDRKARQRETFLQVPLDRLLIETDAPDQPLPAHLVRFSLPDFEGKPVNHPGNLASVYEVAAALFQKPLPELAAIVAENFQRVFGQLLRQ